MSQIEDIASLEDTTSRLLPLQMYEPFKPMKEVFYYPIEYVAVELDQKPDQMIYLACIMMSFFACLILG